MSKTFTFFTKSRFIPKQTIFYVLNENPKKRPKRGRKKSEEKMNPSHSECVKEISHPIFFQNTFFYFKTPTKKKTKQRLKREKK